MIKIENLIGGYMNCPIINGINLEIHQGEFFTLLGPNGSGKSTLFKLLTGQLPVMSGNIFLCDRDISTFSKLEKAKKMAVLTQESQVSFDYTVEEIVSLGRYPHQKGFLKQLSKSDRSVMEEVMEITNIRHYRNTPYRMISGGEKQRVLLAKALAQEPEILLLDEPTNHLDIKHTLHMLDLLKEWQLTKGLTIFTILHDLNIASLYADRVALLHQGSLLDVGDVDRLRNVDQLKKVYEVELNSGSHPTIAKPQILITPSYSTSSNPVNFQQDYWIEQSKDFLHVEFDQPLRTISNGIIGDGIQWSKHFCCFDKEKQNADSALETDLQQRLNDHSIPFNQAVAVMTSANLKELVIVKEEIEGIQMLAIVSTAMEEATDKTVNGYAESILAASSINIMLFVDAHLTDGALVTAYALAIEAKMKALQDLTSMPTPAIVATFDTTGDSLILGLSQQGERTANAGARTVIGKGISTILYQAVQEAVKKSGKSVVQEKETLIDSILC